MKVRIRDALWTMVMVALSLAWLNNSSRQASYAKILEHGIQVAELRAARSAQLAESGRLECKAMDEEVRLLRGLLKTSIADQRDWFELEVSSNRLIAIRPATPESPKVTLQTVEQIEAATGMEAQRIKHFMTPISQLQLRPD
jgi:hypothetical protein